MTWANFDDNFADHPKVSGLTDGAFRLHTSGILYCARYLTNGVVPVSQVPRLTPTYKSAYVTELCGGGDPLWHLESDGYHIHDYLQWNRSREQILSERRRKSEAGRRGARRRWNDE